MAWATTIHKVQGLTLIEIVVDMKGGHFSPGQVYVAFSRVKTLEGLHILNFNATAIKSSDKVQKEMDRLNTKLLVTVPQLQYHSLSNSHVTLALLNVRSITAKTPDILQDKYLGCANVLCFCETWLSLSHLFPPLHDHHIMLRCDRATDNHKRGVMITVVQNMQPSHTLSYTCYNGIQCLTTRPLLPSNTYLNVILVYRSPSNSMDIFTNLLTTLLQN